MKKIIINNIYFKLITIMIMIIITIIVIKK